MVRKAAFVEWAPVIAWMAVIYFLSSRGELGGMSGPQWFLTLRKGGHVVEFAVLALLVGRALRHGRAGALTPKQSAEKRIWAAGSLICLLYAVSDEFHQSFVPGREAHIQDVIIDMLSAVAALGLVYIVKSRRPNPSSATLEPN